jgi:hypothetical protein
MFKVIWTRLQVRLECRRTMRMLVQLSSRDLSDFGAVPHATGFVLTHDLTRF